MPSFRGQIEVSLTNEFSSLLFSSAGMAKVRRDLALGRWLIPTGCALAADDDGTLRRLFALYEGMRLTMNYADHLVNLSFFTILDK